MADGVQFEEEQQYQQPVQTEQKPFFIRIVLSTGIVSTDQAAQYVLLGIAAIGIIISLFLFFGGGKTPQKPPAGILEQMPINNPTN